MAKNLKVKIKNTQLAQALQLDKLKKKKAASVKKKVASEPPAPEVKPVKGEEKEKVEEVVSPPEATPAAAPTPAPEKPAEPVRERGRAIIIKKGPPPSKDKPPVAKTPVQRKDRAVAEKSKGTPAPPKTTRRPASFKDFRDVKPQRKSGGPHRGFDSRDRMGLRVGDDDKWRRRRQKGRREGQEDLTIRPSNLTVRLPISVKDLASEMKLKASQLIAKLFLQGIAATINDYLDDETTVQLLGHEFKCEIAIDTSEEERIKITAKTVREEIQETDLELLTFRPPVVTFMGHVDHGKTSLIDAIRKSTLTSGEAGAITQHIGAFKCHSAVGDITILDTPGHEAFSAMRARGASVTDLVVLVIAGDEGIRDQTIEAINQAKEASVPILVAINKSDKPGFNTENIYRELSEQEHLPEARGGTTITVNCSAVSGEGIQNLLEMLSLQSEVLELKANKESRARGSVIESAMHKGLGSMATVLVQNGTLRTGDCLVFDIDWARVKTMHDEQGKSLLEAPPSTPVKVTGISGLPEAGSEFITVASEKEAREISAVRQKEHTHKLHQKGRRGIEGLLEKKAEVEKKILHVMLRADVQGSLEALKQSLEKIHSDKAEVNIVSSEVGQISESDVELAGASGAVIMGFHTKVESHAEGLINQKKVTVKLHDIIYHAIDEVKSLMRDLLDKLPEENETGEAEVKAVFKSSHLGLIAGCQITDGLIKRSHHARLVRDGEVIWKGMFASLKRGKEDVKEVSKGVECGILLQNFSDIKEGDLIQAYEITYLEQEL
ncbi:MAG: Translation initiation factor IF-2 [Chlamydiae bacterium]|nr:Translation initiation factor IF-2 [Chlamydiota bacterium]